MENDEDFYILALDGGGAGVSIPHRMIDSQESNGGCECHIKFPIPLVMGDE